MKEWENEDEMMIVVAIKWLSVDIMSKYMKNCGQKTHKI